MIFRLRNRSIHSDTKIMVLGDMTSIAQITKHLNLQQKIMKVHIRPEIAVANVRCRHLANIAVKKLLHVKSLHSSVDSS